MGRNTGKVRLRGVKGKRWKKGQSSSSNPLTKKHRLAAKGKFGNHLAQVNPIPNGRPKVELTTDALASHNAYQGDEDIELASEGLSDVAVEGETVEEGEDDTPSLSMTTTSTVYSLLESAHPVFGKVKKLCNSPLESHREICAVLAAISDVIKSSGGKETVTEYFGALVTALESAEDEKSCTAISFLLNTAMSKTPVEVLQSRYSSVCKIVADKLTAYEMSDSVALLKQLVGCLMLLLGPQLTLVWGEGYTQRVFQLLLNYTIHPKPKLRKAAQGGVVSMLREGSSNCDFHCAVKMTASHCSHLLEKRGTETSTLHLLGMLKDCLANMKPMHVKLLCEQILKLVSIGNSVVRTTAFKTLHGLFSSVAGPQGLTVQLNAKLITALYDYQPSHQDVQLLNAWLVVMESAHQRLLDLDLDLGVAHLPKLFSCIVDCFMANAPFVKKTAASLLEKILKRLSSHLYSSETTSRDEAFPTLPEAFGISISGHPGENLFQVLGPHLKALAALLLGEKEGTAKLEAIVMKLGEGKVEEEVCCALFQTWLGGGGRKPISWDTLADILQEMSLTSLAKAVRKQKCGGRTKESAKSCLVVNVEQMFRAVEMGLKYKYLSSWKYVLRVLATFYEVAGKSAVCRDFMTKSLLSLSELRMSPNFPYCRELDAAFGSAITAMGPRIVLSAVPLDLSMKSLSGDFPRSWILPVLKDHVQRTELAYFTECMLPLAAALKRKGLECLNGKQPMEAKLYGTLQFQVWSLLPSFCTDTTDIVKSFRPLARILGTALKERAELRPLIYKALQQLISKSSICDEDKAVLASFSKNFLPILFNLYSTPPKEEEPKEREDKQSLLLECIKAYITITDQELLDTFFSRLMDKLKDDSNSSYRPLLLNVAAVLSPRLLQPSLVCLFQCISPLLDSGDSALQKKAYNCLETMLSGSSVEHQAFLRDHLEALRKILVECLSTASIASKKPRLRCLLHIVGNLSEGSEDFVTSILPEVILSTKEVNEKARMLAYKLVLNIGRGSQCCFGGSAEESIVKYFSLVFAGLAGSPRMVSCTLLSLSKLVYEFHDLLGTGLVHDIFSSTLEFLSSSQREVVRSALALIRVAVGILPVQDLLPQAEILVKTVLCWGENKRNHFRLKYRALLERLVRRLDYEVVASFVPKKHQRLMVHIRKMASRQKHRKMKERLRLTEEQEEEHHQKRTARHKPSYDELLQSSDEEDEGNEDGAWVSKKERGRLFWKNRRDKKHGSHEFKKEEGKAWIKEGPEDEPVNFMDPVVAKKVVATDPAKMKSFRNKSIFATDGQGRLVIQEGEVDALADNLSEQLLGLDGIGRKRKGEDVNEISYSGSSVGRGIHRTDAKKEDFKTYGAEYKAKRAKGDVKKKGAPDPYAYIPLNRQKLNKRKKAKLSGQFKNMVGKAVKGSAVGVKKRRKN